MSLENLDDSARDELAALAKVLAENPATRKDFLRMTKKVKPDMPIPELEIEEATRKAMEASARRVDELEARLRDKEAIEDLQSRRQKLMKKGVREEEIDEIEKVMLDKGITNHEAAAEYWSWMKQAAAPTPTGYNPSAIKKFDLGKYWKNPVAGAREEASQALADFRRQSSARPIGL
jgi:hypothetical protein